MKPPAPPPDMVSASRRHLTDQYASGVDRLLWDTEKRLLPDRDAIRAVLAAAETGQAEALDIGAALVLLQAARLELDRLEYQTLEAARGTGMQDEAIAAVLELPDAATARARHQALAARQELPYEDLEAPQRGTPHAGASERAARRATQAADRGAEAAWRREYHHAAVRYRRLAAEYRAGEPGPGGAAQR